MAAKAVQSSGLLRPSEFYNRQENELKRRVLLAGRDVASAKSDAYLIPPSKYTSGKTSALKPQEKRTTLKCDTGRGPEIPHIMFSRSKNDMLKPSKNRAQAEMSNASNETAKTPSDFLSTQKSTLQNDAIKDSSAVLLREIQSCKKQNAKLHQELISQLQKLTDEKLQDSSSASQKAMGDTLSQAPRNNIRNTHLHDIVETKAQKQAEAVDRMLQQFLEHQFELNANNEKLSRQLLRMQEEHRDTQLHLQKQLDLKEGQCCDYRNSLQKIENELQDLKVKSRSEVNALQKDMKLKDELVAALEEENKVKDKSISHLQSARQKELSLLQENTSQEIVSLKEALVKCQKEYEVEKKEHEKTVMINLKKEKEINGALNAEKQEVKQLKEFLEEKNGEIRLLSVNIRKKDEELLNETEQLRSKMQREIDSLENQFSRIKSEYEDMLKDEKECSKTFIEKFESTTKELDRAKAEVKDLHAYIAEKDSESNSDNFKVKLRLLENENMQFRDTCQSLESAVELLNVRLLSLNNIIKIQEAELSKDGIHIVEEKSVKMLSKWRDKVYSLLVQLKSHEILENEDLKNLQNRLKTAQRKSQEQTSRISLLENQLAERNADLEMKNCKLLSLSREVANHEEKHANQRENEKSLQHCYHQISLHMTTFIEHFGKEMGKLEESMKIFRSLEGRISFAGRRLVTVQNLFQRKDIILQNKLSNVAPGTSEDQEKGSELSRYDKQSLLAELKSLTDEREVLRGKIKKDTEKMVSFEKNLEAQYRTEIESQNKEIVKLKSEVALKNKENDEMKMNVNRLEAECGELKRENERILIDSERLESQFEKELVQKLSAEKERYREEISNMERIVSDTRREHTKAIVSLQQLERQMQWQKQNHEKLIKENEDVFKHELNQLKRKARELEKERNILLTTIKQENMKMPRMKHVGLQSSTGKERERKADDGMNMKRRHNIPSEDGGKFANQKDLEHESGKLSLMLKELQSISASLLRDDKSLDEADMGISESNTSEEL